MKVFEFSLISIAFRKKLTNSGIATVEQLARLRISPRGCLSISISTGIISLDDLHRVINIAVFSQVKGISYEHTSFLVRCGIDSVDKLAVASADQLLFKMALFDYEQGNMAILPSSTTLERWTRAATNLTGKSANLSA
jgi:hypothetical protein